jgi:lipopolysaccharide export system ATP-binding protein
MSQNFPGVLVTIIGLLTVLAAAAETLGIWSSRRRQISEANLTRSHALKQKQIYERPELSLPLLETVSLSATQGSEKIHDVGITVNKREIVALIGPLGAGQSTLLKLVAGMIPTESGEVFINGVSAREKSLKERIHSGLTYVSLKSPSFLSGSVEKNISIALKINSKNRHLPATETGIRLEKILNLLSLEKYRTSDVTRLSIWHKKHLALAIAVATEPKIILLDEPFSQYGDPEASAVMVLIEYAEEHDISILIAETGINIERALTIAERGYVFNSGEIIAAGKIDELAITPELRTQWMGNSG